MNPYETKSHSCGEGHPTLEDVTRLLTQHATPLLALKAYASAISKGSEETSWQGRGEDAHYRHLAALIDLVLRCNGHGVRLLEASPSATTFEATEDFFVVAVAALLPQIFSWERAHRAEVRLNASDADTSGVEGATDGVEQTSCRGSSSVERKEDEHSDPERVDAYLREPRQLEVFLEQIGQNGLVDTLHNESVALHFLLMSLTLSNWACAALRYRITAKGYTLFHCSAAARRCATRTAVRTASPGSVASASFSTSHTTRDEETPVETRCDPTYASWCAYPAVSITQELNNCAEQLMLCNGPEALDDARAARDAAGAERATEEDRGGFGNHELLLLRTLTLLAGAVSEEYENAEAALATYRLALQALHEVRWTDSVPFELAVMRDRMNSILTRMVERLSRFVAEARKKAIAKAAATESFTMSLNAARGKKRRTSPAKERATAPTGKSGSKAAKTSSGVAASGSAAAGVHERDIVLDVPPIDSALRTSIRHLGLPVTVFTVLPLEDAFHLLIPAERLATLAWTSPFEDAANDGHDVTPRDSGIESQGAVHLATDTPRQRRGLRVAAIALCTETPLQWALEAAALAAHPPIPRYSVWGPPVTPALYDRDPVSDVDRAQGLNSLVPTVPSSRWRMDPEEPISGTRLARFLHLTSKRRGYNDDDDYDGNAAATLHACDTRAPLWACNIGNNRAKEAAGRNVGDKPMPVSEAPLGLLAASIGSPPPTSALDGAKKGVANVVKLLSSRLNVLVKAEKAYEGRWAATEKVKSALMSYYVPRQLATLKADLLEKQRFQAAREDYCAKVLVRFFRRVVQEKPRLRGFLTQNERRAMQEEAAAVVLQRYARRWLAVQARKTLEAKRDHAMASVIWVQSMYRKRCATRRVEAIRASQRAADAARGAEARRHFAAMLIQKVYRGHATRQQFYAATGQHDRALRHHLHDWHHHCATLIQKRVRGMLARLAYGAPVEARRWLGRNTYRTHLLTESSITIQRYYRGYRVRRQLWDAVCAIEDRRERKARVGYFFKRYLGPHAIKVTPEQLSEKGGLLMLPVADTAVRAVDERYADGFAAGDVHNARYVGTAMRPPRDAAAVKIQRAYRRWAAVRLVAGMRSARDAVVASRRTETYKPFVADELVF